ncbi:fumarylacetoacetate hydrolase family protein [Sphingomonas bacterium]|uniref:fumarylacetoacetate hydrolase family protein n=1 Tax=Sphingomonas bacterium TaxID=1895847 RepID=UPI001575122B|nr:fumarylacetoacetate hydrolase family protein [Sphingomonas bacterium]
MKLASHNEGADGRLLVVSRDLTQAVPAEAATTLQAALDDWEAVAPALDAQYRALNNGTAAGAAPLDPASLAAVLPRAYQFLDASAFLEHNFILAHAWGIDRRTPADPPLIYQGLSDRFYPPHGDVPFRSTDDGIDFEAEFGVIVDRVPLGTAPAEALGHVRLVLLLNDWSLRAFGPEEMKGGFGFLQAKPPSALSGIAVTPDELGAAWADGRVHLPVTVTRGDTRFGMPHGREMTYGFDRLIAHAAATRDLCAGTVIGSGTVSNADAAAVGSACIAERRGLDTIAGVEPVPFLGFGERVRIEAFDAAGKSVFGLLDHRIARR